MSDGLPITTIRAREILDSRGFPTLEVEVRLAGGARGRATVPSGASTGSRGRASRRGRQALPRPWRAAGHREREHRDRLGAAQCMRADDQAAVDTVLRELDGTPQKARLGANAILGVSLAVARASTTAQGILLYRAFGATEPPSLPVPMLNVLNGGRHAAAGLDFQELMIVPAGAVDFAEALRAAVETYWAVGEILAERGLSTAVGDEGGYVAALPSVEAALDCIVAAIERAGYQPGADVALALDPAASEFYRDGQYVLTRAGGARLSSAEMIEWYRRLVQAYPIASIEDGLGETDWGGWKRLTRTLGAQVLLVGDDLFVTNAELVRQGINQKVANAVLVKLNQIGTVTETLEAIRTAREGRYRVIVSHRSGETEDVSIADFAVAVGADFIKTGAPCRGERVAKYNRLPRPGAPVDGSMLDVRSGVRAAGSGGGPGGPHRAGAGRPPVSDLRGRDAVLLAPDRLRPLCRGPVGSPVSPAPGPGGFPGGRCGRAGAGRARSVHLRPHHGLRALLPLGVS
jgi:enolase